MNKQLNDEQSHFWHGNDMSLEVLARSLFGDRYFGSVNWTDIKYWKKFYLEVLEVLNCSLLQSIGSIDRAHRKDIEYTISDAIRRIQNSRRKDAMHCALIVSLFKLVFLLSGRMPYVDKGKRREFSTFRTLTYSQTEHQMSWLLESYIQNNAESLGFGDHFDASYAFYKWRKDHKLASGDRSSYVRWVRETLPDVYDKYRNI